MRAHGALVVATVVMAGGGVDPAHADSKPVTVAQDGTVTLELSETEPPGRTFCIAVRDANSQRGDERCSGWQHEGVATDPTASPDGVAYVGVAVPGSVASVEARVSGRLVGTAVTVAGAQYIVRYAGAARFALVRLAPKTPVPGLRVHALDAAGTLVAVLDAGGPRLVRGRRLLSGPRGRFTWSLREEVLSSLTPIVFDLAREDVTRCVVADVGRGIGVPIDPTGDCTTGSPLDELMMTTVRRQVSAQDRCAPDFRLMRGVVPAAVQRVSVLLADGRSRTAPTVLLGDGERRAWRLRSRAPMPCAA
jgi:hypothetical protein